MQTDCSSSVPDAYKWDRVACAIDLEPNEVEEFQTQLVVSEGLLNTLLLGVFEALHISS